MACPPVCVKILSNPTWSLLCLGYSSPYKVNMRSCPMLFPSLKVVTGSEHDWPWSLDFSLQAASWHEPAGVKSIVVSWCLLSSCFAGPAALPEESGSTSEKAVVLSSFSYIICKRSYLDSFARGTLRLPEEISMHCPHFVTKSVSGLLYPISQKSLTVPCQQNRFFNLQAE